MSDELGEVFRGVPARRRPLRLRAGIFGRETTLKPGYSEAEKVTFS